MTDEKSERRRSGTDFPFARRGFAHALILVSDFQKLEAWRRVAEQLAPGVRSTVRVVGAETGTAVDASALWIADGPAAVAEIAHTLAAGGERPQAVVLVNTVPVRSEVLDGIPVLVLRGRQSERLSHADAVAGYESLQNGRLVELENCRDAPEVEHPTAMLGAISWFVKSVGGPAGTGRLETEAR